VTRCGTVNLIRQLPSCGRAPTFISEVMGLGYVELGKSDGLHTERMSVMAESDFIPR